MERYAAAVRIEKIQLLYRQSGHAAAAALISACIWTALMWPVAERAALLAWIGAVLMVTAIRLTLFRGYRRSAPEGNDVLRWDRPYAWTLMLGGAVWGLGCPFVMPAASHTHQIVTLLFLIGMSGAAIPAYGAIGGLTLSLIALLLLPTAAVLLIHGDSQFALLALATIWFFATCIRAVRANAAMLTRNIELAHQLRATTQQAEQQALLDALTEVGNRRAFYLEAEAVLRLERRERLPAALMIIDVDRFKEINDAYGHAVGDLALRHVAQVLRSTLRACDVIGRLGGDEFAVLLPNANVTDAHQVAEKLRRALAQSRMNAAGEHIALTLSIGITAADTDLDASTRRADAAMYEAKRAGRDQIVTLPGERACDAA
jgi:diguanylate cyclase (GGDEF)-like protein